MGGAREKDQADFDLDRFIDMFDEAITSNDPRVLDALRGLMMIVTLTRPESRHTMDRNTGPLRRLYDDVHHINSRLHRLEEEVRHYKNKVAVHQEDYWGDKDKYTLISAAQMAQQIDNDIIRKLTNNINGGNAGLNAVLPKGKLTK